MDSKKAVFVILNNHTNSPIRKERLSPRSKARGEASRNKFVRKARLPDRVESCGEVDVVVYPTPSEGWGQGEVDRSKNGPKLWFVKPIRNELRKEQHLIESR